MRIFFIFFFSFCLCPSESINTINNEISQIELKFKKLVEMHAGESFMEIIETTTPKKDLLCINEILSIICRIRANKSMEVTRHLSWFIQFLLKQKRMNEAILGMEVQPWDILMKILSKNAYSIIQKRLDINIPEGLNIKPIIPHHFKRFMQSEGFRSMQELQSTKSLKALYLVKARVALNILEDWHYLISRTQELKLLPESRLIKRLVEDKVPLSLSPDKLIRSEVIWLFHQNFDKVTADLGFNSRMKWLSIYFQLLIWVMQENNKTYDFNQLLSLEAFCTSAFGISL